MCDSGLSSTCLKRERNKKRLLQGEGNRECVCVSERKREGERKEERKGEGKGERERENNVSFQSVCKAALLNEGTLS